MTDETQERRKRRSRIALPDGLKLVCRRLLVPVCAMVAGGLGLAAFLGWVLGLPFLASLGPGKIPMAPSTAMLFVLYGVTIFLRSRLPHRGVYWTGLSVHATGVLIALLLVVLFYQGIHLEAEHLGFSIPHTPGLTPVGHMFPVTALCFLLASLSFLASLPAFPARPWRALAASLLACLLLAISYLLVLADLLGTPLSYQGSLIPPALPSNLAFVALGAALLALALPHAWQSLRQDEPATRFPYDLIAIFIILTMGILTVGHLFYRGYETRCRIEAEHQLSAVANLKVAELVKWRGERIGDAEIIYKNTIFSMLVSRYFNDREDSETERQLREWLGQYQKNREYDQVRLLDREGVTRMSSPPDRPPASAAVLNGLAEVLQTGRITSVDLYRHDYDRRIYFSVLIPILDASADNRVIGSLSLRVDPEKYLYPFILRWPTSSPTAETLLVRRDGNDVLYLNAIRFIKDAALKSRCPLERTDIPVVMAVLGRTGIVEGVDCRGEPVIADVRPVSDSPWFLVVRMNTAEVYAPAREYLWMIVGLMTALVFGTGAGLAFVWRQQNLGFYGERLAAAEALRKSEERFRTSIENMLDCFGVYSAVRDQSGKIVDFRIEYVNAAACANNFMTREGQVGKLLCELLPTHRETGLLLEYCRVVETGNTLIKDSLIYEDVFGEKRLKRAFDIRATKMGDGFIISWRDITEHKRAQEQILRSLAEKEVLLKEIHHRVKNNMQVIYSLLNLQANTIDDSKVRVMFEESRNRVSSMALMHEKLYQSEDLAQIDFKEYLQSLVQGIADTYKRHDVHLSVEMEHIALDVNVGIPCGLIVNELVTNSLKHAFPEGKKGTIRVGINKNSEGNYVLTVEDNGIGFPAEKDFRNTSSLGLRLVNVLTGQIRGTIELSRSEGTRFSITFPGTT